MKTVFGDLEEFLMIKEAIVKDKFNSNLLILSKDEETAMQFAKEVAANESVGQFSNVGIGMGMITGVGGEIGRTVGAVTNDAMKATVSQTPQQVQKRFCMNCGHELSAGALFCEKCGTKVQVSDTCSNCGYVFTNDANFCPKCGTRREK